ncbi:hypothetical protein SAMN05216516_102205 [Izhakiella capsodis]|uniref:Uncharacterized protein n=1 Tax=Izhakiella capsodis TaxID=1367852 RepID=A0A1I4W1B5_9GAMM|nr:hypothetical protein [Izhakiella capsodis]SFN07117.1 hypothetical protein SAMN05216516_102205 [Izhakiella capsodis]
MMEPEFIEPDICGVPVAQRRAQARHELQVTSGDAMPAALLSRGG